MRLAPAEDIQEEVYDTSPVGTKRRSQSEANHRRAIIYSQANVAARHADINRPSAAMFQARTGVGGERKRALSQSTVE